MKAGDTSLKDEGVYLKDDEGLPKEGEARLKYDDKLLKHGEAYSCNGEV